MQLFKKDGQMFRYGKFLSEYNIPVSRRAFEIIFDALPAGVKLLLSSAEQSNVPSYL